MTDTTSPVLPPPAPPVATAPQTDGKAIAALVLAIVGWIVLPIIGPILALVFASGAKKRIDASGGTLAGRGLAVAGQVVAWVSLTVWVLIIGSIMAITFLGAEESETFEDVGTELESSSFDTGSSYSDAADRAAVAEDVYLDCDNIYEGEEGLVFSQVAALGDGEFAEVYDAWLAD